MASTNLYRIEESSITTSDRDRISLLFGSGISIPAELPSIDAITQRALSGQGVWKSTDDNYYLNASEQPAQLRRRHYVSHVSEFLQRLKVQSDKSFASYHPPRESNYEDLFYLAKQISDSESGELENPAIEPFIDIYRAIADEIFDSHQSDEGNSWNLSLLSREAEKYLTCVVWQLLVREPSMIRHLDCIVRLINSSEALAVNMFTLNHDTVLERALTAASVQFDDGFGKSIRDVRYWEPAYFERPSSGVRLLKLHGSINWFSYPPNEVVPGIESIGIPKTWDFWHTLNPEGELQWPRGGSPEILVGTFNKMLAYTSGIYADVYYHFRRFLRASSRLVISGYGFGDKAINTQIIEWLYSSGDNLITLIDPQPDEIPNKARFAISKNWDDWINQHKLITISKGIEDVSLQELTESIH